MGRWLEERAATAGSVLLMAGLVAGCSGEADEPAPIEVADGTTSPAPSAGPTDAADDEALDTRDVTFDPLPDHPDRLAPAVETYVTFEQLLGELLRTARVPDGLSDVASPALVDFHTNDVTYLRRTDQRYAGTARVTVDEIQGNRSIAVVDGCLDATELMIPNDERDPRPGDRSTYRATVTNAGGQWRVTSYDALEESC